MSAKAMNENAAWGVMQYLTGEEAGKVMAPEGRQTSARKAGTEDPRVTGDPVLLTFKEQLATSQAMPDTPAMRKVWSPATTAMNKVINGRVDPAAAMKEASA